MKTTIQLLSALALCFAVQSCGGDDASGEDSDASGNDSNTEVNQDDNDGNDDNAGSDSDESSNETTAGSNEYHISLDTDNGEIATGMTTGKAMISDQAIICTVGDWKMRVLTDEYSPAAMVGNIYNAHIISEDYNSNACTCQFMNVEGTGEVRAIGERVKVEGEITCDEGAVGGTFVVQMIEPKK